MMITGIRKPAAQRGATRLDERQADTLNREGAADVTAVLEEVGLAAKTGWYASIVLYGTGGIATAILYLLMPESIPVGVFVLALVAVGLGVLSVFGALYLTNANWATHLRLTLGLSIFLVGAFVAGPSRVAFVLLPLFTLVTPAFLYGARFAIPYTVLVTAVSFSVLALTEGPARMAHAWITVGSQGMIVLSFMVAEQATRRLARMNRELAYSDPLTGIANMRRLRERLAEVIGRAGDATRPFALYAIDLDNFKLVNDNFDHGMGDRVLRAVAEELTNEVEPGDLVARRGGDEFSVLVIDADSRDLDDLARRLAAAIGRARARTCPQVTPSGSVAYVRSKQGDTTASVLQRADDALHDAKTAFHTEHRKHGGASVTPFAPQAKAPTAYERRRASLERVSAAVSRAYSPRRHSTRDGAREWIERFRRWWGSLNPMWSFSAVALLPAGVSLLVLAPLGWLDPLPWEVGLLCGAGYLMLAGVGLWASAHGWPECVMHLGFISAGVFTAWSTWAAGPSGAALIDIFAVLALYSLYFLGPKQALPYLFAYMGAFSYFAIAGDYPYGALRAGITDVVVIVLAGLVAKVRSVTVRFARRNAELSEVDPLTGVANVRALGFRVADVVNESSRDHTVPAIVTVDLDSFKLVNDRYNHTVGDQVIESVARSISEAVRADEMVARRGGDEFFVLFRDAANDHVGAVVERLHDAIQHTRRRICPDLPCTASISMVSRRDGESAEEFLRRADLAMHDEKLRVRRAADRKSA